MRTWILALAVLIVPSFLFTGSGFAHHSYAMFNGSRIETIVGTVAKLEWTNPHVFLWVYVANPASDTGYDLYAFENGSPNVLSVRGWSPTYFAEGEPVAISYWPVKDGQNGGHLAVLTRADGTVVYGAGGPGGSPDAGKAIPPPAAPEVGR